MDPKMEEKLKEYARLLVRVGPQRGTGARPW